MLNFFKKSIQDKETPQAVPLQQPIFETGKERSFKDEKSGEFVYQRSLSPDHRKSIMAAMGKTTVCANQAIQMFMGFMNWLDSSEKLKNEIVVNEKNISDIVSSIRDEMKLDKRWLLNPQLFVLERREPADA